MFVGAVSCARPLSQPAEKTAIHFRSLTIFRCAHGRGQAVAPTFFIVLSSLSWDPYP